MPGVPIEMPSDTVMVLNSTPLPPAASAPAQRLGRELVDVHVAGRELLQVEAMPICGLLKSRVLEAHGAQHGARRRLLRAIDHQPRILPRVDRGSSCAHRLLIVS